MRSMLKSAVVVCCLALAGPALAQYTFAQPGQVPAPVQPTQSWNDVARVNLGVSNVFLGTATGTIHDGLTAVSGGHNGYRIGALQLVASPEFHF